MSYHRPKTIFCDIDGTLVYHSAPYACSKPDYNMELLDGTISKLLECDRKGYNIILTTGRRKSLRKQTERQLAEAGIFYDELIMGIGGGPRYIINDKKTDGRDAAFSISLDRDVGIKDIDL